MTNKTLKLSVIDTEKVKTLIELLAQQMKSLPDDLVKQLQLCSDSDALEYGYDQIELAINSVCEGEKDYSKFSIMADGIKLEHVKSVNTILKRVTSYKYQNGFPKVDGSTFVYSEIYPEKMTISYGNNTLVEW